jgi:uncharacterized protein (DUF952 family)
VAVTYHLVPAEIWARADPMVPYEAASLVDEGFVHCTDGADELVATAERHLRDDPRPYVVLTIDLAKVGSPWRYDVPGSPYPHVYGPIDREAVLQVTPIARGPGGEFLAFDGGDR